MACASDGLEFHAKNEGTNKNTNNTVINLRLCISHTIDNIGRSANNTLSENVHGKKKQYICDTVAVLSAFGFVHISSVGVTVYHCYTVIAGIMMKSLPFSKTTAVWCNTKNQQFQITVSDCVAAECSRAHVMRGQNTSYVPNAIIYLTFRLFVNG